MSDVKSAVPGSREEQIKAMAYRLWLEEGCPEGRAEAHWFQAIELVGATAAAAPAVKPKSRPKAVIAKVASRSRKAGSP